MLCHKSWAIELLQAWIDYEEDDDPWVCHEDAIESLKEGTRVFLRHIRKIRMEER